MKGVYILCIAILCTILLYILLSRGAREGFETLQDKLQDRANPLAATTNPLQNPAAAIGIPESVGASLQNLASVAFGKPASLDEPIPGPRIDNENSFLGMIQFCKTAGATTNPFNDTRFAENCGICMTSGSLLTGETFTTPTGILVYPEDKKQALAAKAKNGYPFPRVLPSLKSATCVGASLGEDATPAIALNATDYANYAKAAACAKSATFGNGCGVCVPTKTWSYTDTSANGNSISLTLAGAGNASVYVGGKQVSAITLSDKPSTKDLGPIPEGTVLEVAVDKGTLASPPYLYAAFQSVLPNGSRYTLSADKFMDKDSVSGNFVRHGTAKYFSSINAFLPKLLPGVRASAMKISGTLPVTFLQSDDLAAYSCSTGPFVTQQESYAAMVTDDPCAYPTGQAPGNYDDECLRKTILESGCTSSGLWYSDPSSIAGSMSLGDFKGWILGSKDVNGVGCTGVDTSTPCDPCIQNPTAIPTTECLKLLYTNQSAKTVIGSGYPSSTVRDYTSLYGRVPQFCQPAGTLNPATQNGEAELLGVAKNGYNGKYGMEAVKDYLSDTYNKATNTHLNVHMDDAAGGSKTSWVKCFGLKVANYAGGIPASASGNAVVLAAYGGGPWGTAWFNGTTIPVSTDGIYWISNTPGAIANYPINERVSYYKIFTNSTSSPINATFYSFADNSANVYINNTQISSDRVVSMTLPTGDSLIQMDVFNSGGPSGTFAFCVDDGNKAVLFKTDSSWRVTAPATQFI